ncbi:multidrug efflux RND transporter permease subunit [Pseudovibrio japonicus]|uniref:Efflux pump membrane transporter n=1 Tax=Pseudovibrio japonicus TaxID=366534 RepID=A0ABQ3EAB3_9HYPH|nr:efflux RND transporter permease subunit [Pseudovibrio japonicus]GHB30031.1 multidrug efflux RND transporter permease subunit [Pseudovibrio japonicus]
MARFFISRPVFAWVIAIITMLVGVLGLGSLAIEQYPQIVPTTVQIRASYAGASAETVESSVTTIIEDSMTGLDGLVYMTSNSTPGSASIALTFDDTVDPDIAQVQVQNKLQLVTSQLPSVVQQYGVSVDNSTDSILMVGALTSTDGRYSSLELGNLVEQLFQDPVQRVEGVGSINVFGSGYAMRIWLDPMKLARYSVTPVDVTAAVSEQNTNVSVGNLGAQPAPQGQRLIVPLKAQSQLTSVEEFERILLRVDEDGSAVFLGDVANIEIGKESYGTETRVNGNPSAGFAVNLATGANAVKTAEAVQAKLQELSSALPDGVEVVYPYDTSPFVKKSIDQVYETLAEAIVLVFLVILCFLQSWRATIIPTIAVPIVLLGTFAVLAALGFTINTLTMFAMVLAIGLLVDDAIVVVENVERIMEEEGLDPVEATKKSMDEISSALVGIVLVLSAVFLPMAFMSGSTGVIYRQFSVTIITAMVLSLGVAIILTPAMCASLLKPRKHGGGIAPARWFNRNMDKITKGYASSVARLVRRPFRMLVLLVAIGGTAFMLYERLPSSFLPNEDQGVLMVLVETPNGTTVTQTEALVKSVEDYLQDQEKDTVDTFLSVMGFSFGNSGDNYGMLFVRLKDYEERKGVDAAAIAQKANIFFSQNNRAGQVFVVQPPPIPGMGTSSGFTMYMVDQAGDGQEALASAANTLVANAQEDGRVAGLRGNDSAFETSLKFNIHQQKAVALGLSISDINEILSIIYAGRDVNDFVLDNDLRPVYVQGEGEARAQPEDIQRWYVRNESGEMVSFSAFSSMEWGQELQKVSHYNGMRALELEGGATEGLSSGVAMNAMEEMVSNLDGGYGSAWTGLSYQERLAGNQATMLFALSALVVFLSLAALYESWTVPFAVMLSVPVGILGALAASLIFDQSNDVYFKVGLLTTIGLAARNAILIVEFAQEQYKGGKPLIEAAIEASRMRLRPILMTTFAFMLGVLPLALASGAGSGAQQSIGIGVLGGVATSAVIGIFLIPVFYVAVIGAVQWCSRKEASK